MNLQISYEESKGEPKLFHFFTGKDKTNAIISFSLKFAKNKSDDLVKKCKKLADSRKEYMHLIYAELWKLLTVAWPKDEMFHPNMIKNLDEVLIGFTNEYLKKTGLAGYEPKQKTIAEAHAEGVRRPVPVKKK